MFQAINKEALLVILHGEILAGFKNHFNAPYGEISAVDT